jgi:hypothetical protein
MINCGDRSRKNPGAAACTHTLEDAELAVVRRPEELHRRRVARPTRRRPGAMARARRRSALLWIGSEYIIYLSHH